MGSLMVAYVVLVRVCIALGDLPGAEQAVREMEQVNKKAGIPLFRPWIESLQAHPWLAQGNLTRAIDWAEHTPYRRETLVYSPEIASLALGRVFLADRRTPQSLQLLNSLLSA